MLIKKRCCILACTPCIFFIELCKQDSLKVELKNLEALQGYTINLQHKVMFINSVISIHLYMQSSLGGSVFVKGFITLLIYKFTFLWFYALSYLWIEYIKQWQQWQAQISSYSITIYIFELIRVLICQKCETSIIN